MKTLTSLLLNILLAFAIAPRAHADDNSAIKSKLTGMEDNWEKAYQAKDNATLSSMVAEDFYGFDSKGKQAGKSEVMAAMKKDTDTISSATNKDMEVHVYAPNLATVTGVSTEKGKEKSGKAFSRTYVWVDTWMERNGKWECIAEGVTELSKKK